MSFAKPGLRTIKLAISDNLQSFAALTALMALTFSHPARGQTWTQTSAPTNFDWTVVACSADGRVMMAGDTANTAVYVSTNYGSTWVSNYVSSGGLWLAMVSSADGTCLAGAFYGAGAVTSTNMGASWEFNVLAGGYNYGCLACSADGSNMALAPGQGQVIYFSTNSGSTWFSNYPPVSGLTAVSLSADGKTVVAAANSAANWGALIMSTNLGQDWVIQGALPSGANIRGIAASADCGRLAVPNINSVYTSTNAGVTWWKSAIPASPEWLAAASSADGLQFVAGGRFGPIYTSTNSGVNWSSNNAPYLSWWSVASSADGRRLVAASSQAGIWTSYSPAPPVLDIVYVSNYAKISWLIPSADFVMEGVSDLSFANWSTVDVTPTLNTTNLHYEVIMPANGSNAFYRLRMR